MAESETAAITECPYCGAPASGRFCSACGKALGLHATSGAVLKDTFGLKVPPAKSLATTAWMTLRYPAELTKRWIEGRRQGLATPIAMMGTVTAVTAIVGFVLVRLTGHRAPAEMPPTFNEMLVAAPFLRGMFPAGTRLAMSDGVGMIGQFRATASYLAAFWPALFILPGFLSLAPWRRVTTHAALILCCVESVFLLIATGVWSSLRLVSPALAASGLTTLVFGAAVIAHGAIHVRDVTGSGWGYAITRPIIAAIVFPFVGYAFVVLVMALTLMFATG